MNEPKDKLNNASTKKVPPSVSEKPSDSRSGKVADKGHADAQPADAVSGNGAVTEDVVRRIVRETLREAKQTLSNEVAAKILSMLNTSLTNTATTITNTLDKPVVIRGDILNPITTNLNAIKNTVESMEKTLTSLNNAMTLDDPSQEMGVAAKALAEISEGLRNLSGSATQMVKTNEALRQLQQLPANIENGLTLLADPMERLTDSNGPVSQFLAQVDGLRNDVNQSLGTINDTVQKAKEALQQRQTELVEGQGHIQELIQGLSDSLNAPKMIRDEVVPKLGEFFGSVKASVDGLSKNLDGLKQDLSKIRDLSDFQKKALLAIKFGEACKSLQAAFDKALSETGPENNA